MTASLERMRRAFPLLAAAAVGLAVLAPGAFAQSDVEPGVTVDPNSPAAKEYALPVGRARQDATGKKKSGNAPLFGQGVKPSKKKSAAKSPTGSGTSSSGSRTGSSGTTATAPSGSGSKATSSKPKSSKKSSSSSRSKPRSKPATSGSSTTGDPSTSTATSTNEGSSTPAPQDVAQIAAQANQPTSGGGIGPTLVIGAIGLAVLLAGGLAGLALRRRGEGPGA
jgi:hypothetical protein